MEQWEYWTVEVQAIHGAAEINRQLAWAGSQGWELVATTPIVAGSPMPGGGMTFHSTTTMIILTFKRRVSVLPTT